MEFNQWGFNPFSHYHGEQPVHESYGDDHLHHADESRTDDAQLSQLTGQLSDLRIAGGSTGGRSAAPAPRTGRLGGSARFHPASYGRDRDFQSMRYDSSYTWRMDSAPPGDIPVHEIPDTPPDAHVTRHDSSLPRATTVDPSRRASTSEVGRIPAEARPGPSQSMRMTGLPRGRRNPPFAYPDFLRAVQAWGKGASREGAARGASIRGSDLRTYLGRDGLTDQGNAYLQTLPVEQQRPLQTALAQRSASGQGGLLRNLGRRLGIVGSSSRTAQPVSEPPIAHEAPVVRERERSARWGDHVQASSAAADEPDTADPLPSNHAEIMSLLPDYERGVPLPELQRRINAAGAAVRIGTYFSPSGTYHKNGTTFRNQLPSPDRRRLDAALNRRATMHPESYAPAHYNDIMQDSFLDMFAVGVRLRDLARMCGDTFLDSYFRADGSLHASGEKFRKQLDADDRVRFDAACNQRREYAEAFHRIGRNGFKQIANSLAIAGAAGRVDDAAARAGVQLSDIRMFLTDDGLTPAGTVWVQQLISAARVSVQAALDRWTQLRSQHPPAQAFDSASPSASFFDISVPGGQRSDVAASLQEYEQEALWASLEQPPQAPSPSASFFDFSAPGAQQRDVGAPPGDYEQEALWDSLAPQHASGQSDPDAAGPSSSSQPHAADALERSMAAQASRLGIPFFGADVVGHEWRGASFVDHYQQPCAYAPDRLAGHLAALLHAGEIQSGDLVNIRGVNYRVQPIGGHPIPTPENPHGLMFALYPI